MKRRPHTILPERSYRQSVILLVIGDIICFLVFAFAGGGAHNELNSLASVAHLVLVALSFMLAWFIVSPFLGVFSRDIVAQPRAMGIRTALAWLLSWPVSLLFYALFVYHAVPAYSFALVVLVTNLVLLELWRLPFAFSNAARKRGL